MIITVDSQWERYLWVIIPLIAQLVLMSWIIFWWKAERFENAIKGLFIGFLLFPLIFNIMALFHVNEMIWATKLW